MCAFSTGVLEALIEKHNLKQPDIVVGASGSVGVLSYFLSGQINILRSIWFDIMTNSKSINFWRFWKIADVDYLIDHITKITFPLDKDKIYNSKTRYFIGATDFESCELKFFEPKKDDEIFEYMRASAAIPIAYGKTVTINNRNYFDTILSADPYFAILEAYKHGARTFLVVDVGNTNKVSLWLHDLFIRFKSQKFMDNYRRSLASLTNHVLPKDISLFEIVPKKKLKVFLIDDDELKIRDTFEQGYRETVYDKKLIEFLKLHKLTR